MTFQNKYDDADIKNNNNKLIGIY